MTELSSFVSLFLSYLMVFGIVVLVIVNAVAIGVLLRKTVDKSKKKKSNVEE